jgi:hypothetical protein
MASEAVAPLVTGAPTGLLEHAMILIGKYAAAFAGDLGQNLIEARVEQLLGQNGYRRRFAPQTLSKSPA